MSLKPNVVESKNRVSLSAYSLNISHGGRAVTVVKAAASGVDESEPEKNEEPKTVVASVPVDKLPLESKEANSETEIWNGSHGYDLKRLPMVVAEIKIQLPFYRGSGSSEMERGGSSRRFCLYFRDFYMRRMRYICYFKSLMKVMFPSSLVYQVPEGHVGAYWRGGALLNIITEPGFHLKLPFITNYEPVQVTLQTDQVKDIPCGTKGVVMISFEKIEVVNRLRKDFVYDTLLNYGVNYDNRWIYDKIYHEINQFCSSHSLQQVYIDIFDQIDERMKDALQDDCTRYAPGIEIISVRVTKPKIPESVRRNFEQMEEERTKVLIAIEKQRVAEKEAETKKIMAISEAVKNANVSKILMQ